MLYKWQDFLFSFEYKIIKIVFFFPQCSTGLPILLSPLIKLAIGRIVFHGMKKNKHEVLNTHTKKIYTEWISFSYKIKIWSFGEMTFFFFFKFLCQMTGLWAWGSGELHLQKWKSRFMGSMQSNSRPGDERCQSRHRKPGLPGALIWGRWWTRIHSRCPGLQVRRQDRQHGLWLERGTTEVRKVMEPAGLRLVKLRVRPALSLEMHSYKQNKNMKLDRICLKANEQAVETVLFLFYYLLEILFSEQCVSSERYSNVISRVHINSFSGNFLFLIVVFLKSLGHEEFA